MQGQRSGIDSLRESLGFNHGSTSSDGGVNQQICWNDLQNPAHNHLPDYMVSSNETSIPFFNPVSQESQNAIGWSLGESSSSIAPHCVRSEQKSDHGWSSTMTNCPGASHFCTEQQYGSSFEVNLKSNQIATNTLFPQGSSSSIIPHDLNSNSVFEGHEDSDDDDSDRQVMEYTPYKSDSTNGFLMDDSDGRPESSLDGRRFCKRKALEGQVAQSSGSGSSNYIPLAENSLWHSVPAPHNMTTAANISAPTEGNMSIDEMSEQGNPRLGLSIGGAVMETPLGATASRGAESSHRNFRVRINASRHQDYLPSNQFPAVGDIGNVNLSSEPQLPELLPNTPLDLRSVSAADSGNSQRQPAAMHVPSLHRSAHARWNSASSSRTSSSSFSRERNLARFEEPNSRSVSRNISQHAILAPPTDGRNVNQNPANWSLAGGNISIPGNVVSASRNSSSSGVHTSSPSRVLHRSSPQYPRRLQELVRRSLLSSAGTEPGGHSVNSPSLRLSSAVSHEMAPSGSHVHRPSSSRSTMLSERQLDGAGGVPYSWRTSASAREGRSRLVSEIRNVLDLMRRGEGLRFEDVMILDQSVFFGMPDIHDRHRDMRLDVDNMTYEELLALEERIGDVCTGLSEETISSRLKQRNYICIKAEESEDAEPCCICREEYNNGDDLGVLDCGHDFHSGCIKQWLMHKNLCPICKTAGLAT